MINRKMLGFAPHPNLHKLDVHKAESNQNLFQMSSSVKSRIRDPEYAASKACANPIRSVYKGGVSESAFFMLFMVEPYLFPVSPRQDADRTTDRPQNL